MYLSKLIVRNYRSIQNLDVNLTKGKNILVGKNNAGKSNIIRAIDIVLGDSTPTYYKYENITENDFYSFKFTNPEDIEETSTASEVIIVCLLQRDNDEALNYDEIKNCMGFYKLIEGKTWNPFNIVEKRVRIQDFSAEELAEAFKFNLDCEDEEDPSYIDKRYKCHWIDSKIKNQRKFEDELSDKFQFGYIFRARKDADNKINKDIRFIYREDETRDWFMGFSAPIRNELLQSAIINSFRDPANQLRINQWSWFGKLLKSYINSNDADLSDAFQTLKRVSDGLFSRLHVEIINSNIKIAFPDTNISFQFNPDTKIDIYKSTLVYVDDGFNSVLQDKGSGIQSAVIIGLFDFYTRKIAHCSSSLMAIEEPELYLHPQARRVISNRLDDFLDGGKNQVIVSTHSSEFISAAHENINIIVVRKDNDNGTLAYNATFTEAKEKQILVKTQNAEMFFADKVILVEGGDKYILEACARYYGRNVYGTLGENWLNDKNISIISAGGKNEFWKYVNKLNELSIEWFILSDFDFLLRGLNDFFTHTEWDDQVNKDMLHRILTEIGTITNNLPEGVDRMIDTFNNSLEEHGLRIKARDIKQKLKEINGKKTLEDIADAHLATVNDFRRSIRDKCIYILKNELEDNYTETCRESIAGISGKEEKAIHIVSNLLSDQIDITDLIDCTEFFEFLGLIA